VNSFPLRFPLVFDGKLLAKCCASLQTHLDGNGISDIVFVDADSNSIGVLLSRCSP